MHVTLHHETSGTMTVFVERPWTRERDTDGGTVTRRERILSEYAVLGWFPWKS